MYSLKTPRRCQVAVEYFLQGENFIMLEVIGLKSA